jgi:hypothetical protein
MCWSAEVSLQSFLIGITAVFVGYQNGLSFPVTLFCLTIVFMQLIEYFVWSNEGNDRANFRYSVLASLLLWLQPIASISTLPSKWISTALGSYIGLSFLSSLFNETPLEVRYRMEKGINGHLEWKWLDKSWQTAVSLLVYFVFLFGPLVFQKEWTLLTLALTTLAGSLYSFYEANTWGSMWCWFVNYLVVGVAGYQVLVAKP